MASAEEIVNALIADMEEAGLGIDDHSVTDIRGEDGLWVEATGTLEAWTRFRTWGPYSGHPTLVSKGIELIAAERERQVSVEGWTPEHDDRHTESGLSLAAASYALLPEYRFLRLALWPWDHEWYKPKDRLSDLVRAGALIAAEIDRLLRIEEGGGDS